MKRFLTYPFRIGIQEIRENKQLIKKSKDLSSKVNIYPFMYAAYMYLLIMSIMYITVIYILIGSIFDPIGFIILIPTILTTWIFTLIYTKVFPKTKKYYLESNGFYKND